MPHPRNASPRPSGEGQIQGRIRLGIDQGWRAEGQPPAFASSDPLTLNVDREIWSDAKQGEPVARNILAHEIGHIVVHRHNDLGYSFGKDAQLAQARLRTIVGVGIPLDAIDGKMKLNRDKSIEDRLRIIAAIEERSGENGMAIAGVIRTTRIQDRTRGHEMVRNRPHWLR